MKRARNTAAVRALEIWKRKGRFWWKAARPLSGSDRCKQPFVHVTGRGLIAGSWWKREWLLSGSQR